MTQETSSQPVGPVVTAADDPSVPGAPSVAGALTNLLVAAADAIPSIELASISDVHAGPTEPPVAVNHPLMLRTCELEAVLHQGPRTEAMASGLTVISEDLARERRWPAFTPAALELGLWAQLGLPLTWEGRVLGCLNLYWTRTIRLDDITLGLGEAFATQAAALLWYGHQARELERAMRTRQTIGQAVGILMERFDLTAQDGLAYLSRCSQNENVKLRDIAARFVATRTLPQGAPPRPAVTTRGPAAGG